MLMFWFCLKFAIANRRTSYECGGQGCNFQHWGILLNLACRFTWFGPFILAAAAGWGIWGGVAFFSVYPIHVFGETAQHD